MNIKGIILAGGRGSRLYPITKSVSKQLLPVFDKPMIYYPLAVLMQAQIKDILIITTKSDIKNFVSLLGNGSELGINLSYEIQDEPNGLPEAFIIGENFIGESRVCLILGDNIFYADHFINRHVIPNLKEEQSVIFGYHVGDPERYGVVEYDEKNKVISIEEKPKYPKSNYAVTGLYIFDNDVIRVAKNLKFSRRGEKEIVDVINHYKDNGKLKVELLGRGIAWLDTGTHQSLMQASNFIEVLENRQGLKIACLEEIALLNNWIKKKEIIKSIKFYGNCEYSNYLKKLISL